MFLNYLISNFALFCVAIAMYFILLYNGRGQTRENKYSYLIISTALLLSVIELLELWAKKYLLDVPFWATFFTFLGYIVRPVCVYFFIQLIGKKVKYQWLFYIPLIINAIVYSLALFVNVDALRHLVFYYTLNGDGTALIHNRGFLNFTSHTIAFAYIIYFLINVFRKLNGKHRTDSIVLFVCSFFIIAATTLEALSLAVNLLNVTIAISCLFYYLYLYVQQSRRDALTGCFDRRSFYHDTQKFGRNINGVINIDMNGLKLINDNCGHQEGDKAILYISNVIEKYATRNSYVYRMGGDEFTVLLINGSNEELEHMEKKMKEALKTSKYAVSIGYAFDENKSMSLDELSKIADEQMYIDKENYYKNNHIERRKVHQ